MQLARKSVTSDPFVVYGFYDKLGKLFDEMGLADKPSSIFNMDETGFPTDPSKAKTIGTKGVKTVRITHGANRENITVLATCCADGTALPPLIVFKGKKMQTTWRGDNALPGTQYAVTDSGWMTTSVFEDFFESFVEVVKGRGPILVVLDGHLSHTSLRTVDLAVKNNITILKLPPHCTDLLQPLDVACFAPLKSYYDSKLLEYTQSTGGRENLRKDLFVNMLCSVWNTGLSKENIVAGFRATGIHPLDRVKYNTSRLDTIKLKTYDDWVSAGKPTDDDDQPILPTARTQSLDIPPPPAPEDDETPAASTPTASTPKRTATASTSTDSQTAPSQELKKYTDQQLVDELLSRDEAALSLFFKCLVSSISQHGKKLPPASIEAVLHSRGRRATPLTKKRRVIPMSCSVITDEKCRQKIAEMNESKARPRKKGAPTQTEKSTKEAPKKKATGKKRKLKEEEDEDSDSTVVSSVAMTEANTSSDLSLEDLLRDDLEEVQDDLEEATEVRMEEVTQRREETEARRGETEDRRDETEDRREETDYRSDKDRDYRHDEATADGTEAVTSKNGRPTIEDADTYKYVAVYFSHPKPQYFWGKILKVFSSDEETEVTQVEVDFLQKKAISSDPSAWTWAEKTVKEVLIIDTKFIVFGPLVPDVKKNIFRFPDVEAMASLREFEQRDD